MKPTRVAVIGVGHLGASHARILRTMPEAELCAVVDIREDRAAEIARENGVPWSTDFRRVPGSPDAVTVVVPTPEHAEVAGFFLENGLDVLVEKPITRTVDEAERLIALAEEYRRILQVGHVERFNPAVLAVRELGVQPRYIEAHRLAPFSFRSVETGVVLDLMIHDIDLMLSFLKEPVTSVEAFGGAIFTPAEDMASAVFKFEGGAAAHLTANRVALKPLRRMRLFSHDSYVSLDFGQRYGLLIKKAPGWDLRNLKMEEIDAGSIQDLWKFVFEGLLTVKEIKVKEGEPLREELSAFLRCCRDRRDPVVGGRDGLAAISLGYRVLEAIKNNAG